MMVEFRPAAADTGIVFIRGDHEPPQRIPARVQHRLEVPRRTTLGLGGSRVEMVEHAMGALHGLGIDNCEVWMDRAEMPGCDGSSQPFVKALQEAGSTSLPELRSQLVVRQPLRVGTKDRWVEARPSQDGRLSLECRIDYGPRGPIGHQRFRISMNPEAFCRELAPARTFLLEEEALQLRQQGLGLRVTPRDLLVFDDQGPMDNSLRFPDECVRHKTLDLVGDLALADRDLVGHFVAHCSGHHLNAALVSALLVRQGEGIAYKKSA